MEALLIHRPGPLTTVQDRGRPGLRRYGIPPSGAMDQFSYRVGNFLVGNLPGEASLEATLPGLVLEALVPITLAITGADLAARLNDAPAPMWSSFDLSPGDRLSFTKRVRGCRAYVGVRGGVDAEEFLGSRSTFAKGRMGAPLKAGQTLSLRDPSLPRITWRSTPARAWPERFDIRVILGPQTERFTAGGLATFLAETYRAHPHSDRQGYRTEGPAIEFATGPDIISDPTPLGAVQVPGDGKPIILHRDGQSTGGYSKIATVIAADLDWFGQMAPGDALRFRAVSRDVALAAAREREEEVQAIGALLNLPVESD
ncbi:MAG: biotin-dependent carboxyltransferase family protein [Bryobacteraceae bacterium]